MSSGPKSEISNGTSGSQSSIEQMNSSLQAMKNEDSLTDRIKQSESDYFIGPNGKVLPAKYKKWIGVSRRESLIKKARNPLLKNAISQLYRPDSFIGDGGTASVIKFEKETGLGLGRNGKNHIQKGRDMIKYLDRISQSQSLSASDSKLTRYLANNLRKAIGGK